MKDKDTGLWKDDAYTYASSEGPQMGWFILMVIVFLVVVCMAII